MRVLLRDLTPGQTYAMQFRSNDGVGNTSDWSQVQRFTATNDTTPPAGVTNLTWYDSGTSFIGEWDKVTTNVDGSPLKDFRDYHCNVSNGSTSVDFYVTGERFEFTQEQNVSQFGSLQNSLSVTVTARDLTYNESAPVSLTADPLNPPTPSMPTVQNYLGLLQATSDGKDSTGLVFPRNVLYCEVHASTVSGFTPDDTTYVGRLSFTGLTASYLISGLTYGTLYYIRLVSVNAMGKKSGPSAEGSGTPQRISGLDIANGQISPSQINFTARDIAGANAYYSTSQPTTTDVAGGFKKGDVWYDTDNGYQAYQYDGTTWVQNNDIGVISGTKILAGTLTADAVGTNLLITAAANIGTAVIDSASISSLDVGKLSAGTMSADVVISGRFATAETGARREMNQTGFQAWDSSGNLVINLDGVNNLLTGVFQTALSGRSIALGASGNTGHIDFVAPDGTTSFVKNSNLGGTTEGLSIGVPIANTNTGFWNTLRIDSTQLAYLNAGAVHFAFDSTRDFTVYAATDKGTAAGAQPTLKERFSVTSANIHYYDPGGKQRWFIDSGSMTYNDSDGSTRLTFDQNSCFITNNNSTGYLWVQWPGTNARMVVLPSPRSDTSARIQLVMPSSYGVTLKYLSTSAGASARLQIMDVAESGYCDVYAGVYTTQSSGKVKSNVAPITPGALDKVKGMQIKTYNRAKGKPAGAKNTDPVEYNTRVETGIIAEEAPEDVVVRDETGTIFGIDLGSQLHLAIAAIQELAAEVDALKKGNGK